MRRVPVLPTCMSPRLQGRQHLAQQHHWLLAHDGEAPDYALSITPPHLCHQPLNTCMPHLCHQPLNTCSICRQGSTATSRDSWLGSLKRSSICRPGSSKTHEVDSLQQKGRQRKQASICPCLKGIKASWPHVEVCLRTSAHDSHGQPTTSTHRAAQQGSCMATHIANRLTLRCCHCSCWAPR